MSIPIPKDLYAWPRLDRERQREITKAVEARYLDDQGKPLYTVTEGGRIRRTRTLKTKIKERIRERDGRRCVLCGATANQVDHIIPYCDGGSDDPSNLRTLCGPCHSARSRRGVE